MTPEVKTGLAILCMMQALPLLAGLMLGHWIGRGNLQRIATNVILWLRTRIEK